MKKVIFLFENWLKSDVLSHRLKKYVSYILSFFLLFFFFSISYPQLLKVLFRQVFYLIALIFFSLFFIFDESKEETWNQDQSQRPKLELNDETISAYKEKFVDLSSTLFNFVAYSLLTYLLVSHKFRVVYGWSWPVRLLSSLLIVLIIMDLDDLKGQVNFNFLNLSKVKDFFIRESIDFRFKVQHLFTLSLVLINLISFTIIASFLIFYITTQTRFQNLAISKTSIVQVNNRYIASVWSTESKAQEKLLELRQRALEILKDKRYIAVTYLNDGLSENVVEKYQQLLVNDKFQKIHRGLLSNGDKAEVESIEIQFNEEDQDLANYLSDFLQKHTTDDLKIEIKAIDRLPGEVYLVFK